MRNKINSVLIYYAWKEIIWDFSWKYTVAVIAKANDTNTFGWNYKNHFMQIKDFNSLLLDDKIYIVNNTGSKLIGCHPWYGRVI